MFQATRRRLALWYTAVTAVLVAIVAAGFYTYARATLIERVDDTLHHAIEVVERSLVIEWVGMRDLAARDPRTQLTRPRVNLEASFRDNTGTVWDGVDDDRLDFEWFSPTGDLLWTTFERATAIPFELPELARGPANRSRLNRNFEAGQTVRPPLEKAQAGDGDRRVWRQVVEAVTYEGQILGYLRASHPWFEVTRPARTLLVDLCIGAVAAVGAVAGIGWLLSGLAIEPVRESYQRLRQFTADASHELRNPIATIQTNVQVALAEPEPSLQRGQLETIERLTRRLTRLVDDLLFLARQDTRPDRQPIEDWVDLAEILLATVEEQDGPARSKNIDLIPELEERPPSETRPFDLRGDRDHLARLLTNLIANAVHYSPPDRPVWVRLTREGRWLRLVVEDRGPGIPAAALPHLFDRFYRVDPARSAGGSGLGLAIALAIVQEHQGQIRIDSQPNQGTTAIVTLPAG